MAIIIPKKGEKAEWIRTFEVDGDTSKYASQPVQPTSLVQTQASNLGIARINPREYIQLGINGIHGAPAVISAYELQGSNNKNYEENHKFVLNQGLYMPTPRLFMNYFKQVLEAQRGKRNLAYADGSQVPDSEVEEMYAHLTTNHKNQFGRSDVGAWTWLNARFKTGCLETVTGIDSSGNLTRTSSRLESCLNEDVLATLDINGQGLSTIKAHKNKYKARENIFFYKPRDGRVARFGANSDGARLGCGSGDPDDRDDGLGVFACAEGAA